MTECKIPALFLSKDEYAFEKKPVVFLIHGGGIPDVFNKNYPWAKKGWFNAKYMMSVYVDGERALSSID